MLNTRSRDCSCDGNGCGSCGGCGNCGDDNARSFFHDNDLNEERDK